MATWLGNKAFAHLLNSYHVKSSYTEVDNTHLQWVAASCVELTWH